MKFIIIILLLIESQAFFGSSSGSYEAYLRPNGQGYYYSNSKLGPNRHIDKQFEEELIDSNIMIYWRHIKSFVFKFEHPDLVFPLKNQKEYLIIGFHKHHYRYDVTRMSVEDFNRQYIYHRKETKYFNRLIRVSQVINGADYIGRKDYNFMFNNCKDSAQQLINYLLY